MRASSFQWGELQGGMRYSLHMAAGGVHIASGSCNCLKQPSGAGIVEIHVTLAGCEYNYAVRACQTPESTAKDPYRQTVEPFARFCLLNCEACPTCASISFEVRLKNGFK